MFFLPPLSNSPLQMEMMRKFLLVGLFVTFQPGSILQIALATVVSATYLMVQLQAARLLTLLYVHSDRVGSGRRRGTISLYIQRRAVQF